MIKDCFDYNGGCSKIMVFDNEDDEEGDQEREEEQNRQFSLWKDRLNKKISMVCEKKHLGETERLIKYSFDIKYCAPRSLNKRQGCLDGS